MRSKEPSLFWFRLLMSLHFVLCMHGGRGVFGSEQDHCSWGRGLLETERICGRSLRRGAQTSNQRVGFMF